MPEVDCLWLGEKIDEETGENESWCKARQTYAHCEDCRDYEILGE